MAVIGIWHCPSFPDLPQAYESFRSRAAQFSSAPVMRCFAFEPSVEHMSHEALGSMPLLHLFPTAMSAAPDVPHVAPADDPQLSMLLNMQMCGVSVELLQWVEAAVATARLGDGSSLHTPLDFHDSAPASVAKRERQRKKRLQGRIEKVRAAPRRAAFV